MLFKYYGSSKTSLSLCLQTNLEMLMRMNIKVKTVNDSMCPASPLLTFLIMGVLYLKALIAANASTSADASQQFSMSGEPCSKITAIYASYCCPDHQCNKVTDKCEYIINS